MNVGPPLFESASSNGLTARLCVVVPARLEQGLAFAEKVKSNEVHVNDGYARHGGEGQLAGYTRRQWIGIQTTPTSYPAWAEAQATH